MRTRTLHIVTLGCSKNTVDSEHLLYQLEKSGWTLLPEIGNALPEVVLINTCGFILDAKTESIDTILSFGALKAEGEIDQLLVMGCLSERYRTELQHEIPEVDAWFGVDEQEDILRYLHSTGEGDPTGRYLTTPAHYAYLKVSEGCDRSCAFCAIPGIRGAHLSIPIETLVREAGALAAKGVKELILIAQDLSWYGMDLYKEQRLAELVQKLSLIQGIGWIRLHYLYPNSFPMDLIPLLKDNPKVCRYLDLPVQHISDPVLRKMRRGHSRKQTLDLIHKLQSEIPEISLRTTLMCGHPGEGESEFRELLDFVGEGHFENLGAFTYSPEEDTYGYEHYADDVPQKTKEERLRMIMEKQEGVVEKIQEGRLGTTQAVLIDRQEGDYLIGRTAFQSPEVDGEVLLPADAGIAIGSFVQVRITGYEGYDLLGTVEND